MYSEKTKHMTPAQQAAQDVRAEDDKRNGHFEATEHTAVSYTHLTLPTIYSV